MQQVQKQSQSLVLAPQLRNSLKILQAPAMELRNSILEELQANPLLEELPFDGISVEEQTREPEGAGADDPKEEMAFSDKDFTALQRLDEEWKEYYAQENNAVPHTSEDEERRQHFFDSVTNSGSLQEHLIEQANMADCSEKEKEAVIYMIGSLDDSGFLTESVSDIALVSRLPYSAVQTAHGILQTFDPPGIGATDIRECLLAQLDQRGRGASLAARILRDHYNLLLRRRVPELSRKLGASAEDVQRAIEEISTLEPAPGKRFSEDTNRVVEPDVTVEQDAEGNWRVTLNNEHIPRLRLSNAYKELLARGNLSKQEREYIQERMRSGKFLINSIEQRQQTIERITREILRHQSGFFEHGVSHLRPLTMNTIAQDVGVHETTVSRAIANKYIRTPFGIFEFKYFFTPGFRSDKGEAVSNKSIQDMIQHIVDDEDPAKPRSDNEIVRRLKERDIKIARRTVAKYREELGILPTNLRRRYD